MNFTSRLPDKLIFWERRTSSASAYRLEVRASIDGVNYSLLLARFDTLAQFTSYVQRVIDLSKTGLSNQPAVQFRWIILADSTNNTGVLRLDDVSLTVSTGFDVGCTSIAALPINATRGDSLTLTVGVRNYGSLTSSGFSVQFFSDDNLNGIGETGEQYFRLSELTLSPGDSMTCSATHPPTKARDHRFIATVYHDQDERRSNDTVRVLLFVGYQKGDVVVNEIQYAPAGDEPEWVEFYNTSTDTLNLKNWKISDNNVSVKTLISQAEVSIPPVSYLVVAKDANFSMFHPGTSFIIANFAALNNSTPDAVVLYDPQSNAIDSVMYSQSWGGQNGKSLERIDTKAIGTAGTNWGTSQDSLGSTPGKINSIALLDNDLAITNLTQTSAVVQGRLVPEVHAVVQNVGRLSIDSVVVCFFADSNRNAHPEATEFMCRKGASQRLNAGDSIQIIENFPQLTSGEMNVLAVIDCWRDERLRNNEAAVRIKVGYEPHSLIINEMMYEPLDGQNEWIELFNRSSDPIDLAQWTINDKATSSGVNSVTIASMPLIVHPGEYMVFAADSSLFTQFPCLCSADNVSHVIIVNRSGGLSLNNDGDAVVLKDLTGQTIDSVAYSPRWHHPNVVDTRGRSLERISPHIDSNDPRNWSTCTILASGSPGKSNSILTPSAFTGARLSLSPNPFSPDGDGFEDFCIIRYNLPLMTSLINVRIYDIKGRLIRTLANSELAGREGEIVWNGYGEDQQRARIGVYVVYLEASDQVSGRVETAKAVAVVATRL